MSLPRKAKVGTPAKSVSIDVPTYFIAKRMEQRGVLNRGQALMLAATVPNNTKPQRGVRKRGKT